MRRLPFYDSWAVAWCCAKLLCRSWLDRNQPCLDLRSKSRHRWVLGSMWLFLDNYKFKQTSFSDLICHRCCCLFRPLTFNTSGRQPLNFIPQIGLAHLIGKRWSRTDRFDWVCKRNLPKDTAKKKDKKLFFIRSFFFLLLLTKNVVWKSHSLSQSCLANSRIKNESILTNSNLIIAYASNRDYRVTFLFSPWSHNARKVYVHK